MLIVCLALLVISGNMAGQTIKDQVVGALEKNDPKALVACFHSMVDLQIPGYSGSFSQNQASVIMKKFLADHPVVSVSIARSGNNSDGSKFSLGELVSSGRKYRLHFVTRETEGSERVLVLKITAM